MADAGAVLSCAPGELPLDDGSCRAPGVPAEGCGEGFEPTDDAGCDAVLPTTPCASGQMALTGETQCRPVGTCGTGAWGDIPLDSAIEHVDGSYTGGSSDGSAARPWTTIQAGINAAASGAVVAVAAADYPENVSIDKPVRLWGRCPSMVSVVGSNSSVPSVRLFGGAAGSEVRSLGLTGAGRGVTVEGGVNDVTLAQLWIHDLPAAGLRVDGGTSGAGAELRQSLIEAATEAGIQAYGADLIVEDSVIRSIEATTTGADGVGLDLRAGSTPATQEVAVRHAIVEQTSSAGISSTGSIELSVRDTLLRDVVSEPTASYDGQAIWAGWWSDSSAGPRPTVSIVGSVVERASWIGVHFNGPHAVLERTVIRDMQRSAEGEGGLGLSLYAVEQQPGMAPHYMVSQSVIENVFVNGIEADGVELELVSSIVRDMGPRPDQSNGLGIAASESEENGDPTVLTMRGSVVQRALQGGVYVGGSTAVIEDSAIFDTQPRADTGGWGVGLSFLVGVDLADFEVGDPSDGSIVRTVIDGAHGGGIAVAGAAVTMTDVIVRNISEQANVGDFGDGIGVSTVIPLPFVPDDLPTSASILRATVEGSPRAGVASFAADVSISDSLLSCNAIDLDGEVIDDRAFSLENLGGNVCACDDDSWDCRVLSTNLAPPTGI